MKQITYVKMRLIILIVVLAIIVSACTSGMESRDDDAFVLGFIPSERASELTPKAEDLASFLEQEMGVDVEVVVPTSYEPLMEGIRFGHIDASYMDSGPAWLAHSNAGAEVVLAELNDNRSYYYGEVFVREDSEIGSLDDLPGKRMGFTSWTGSSGFILPMGEMINRGLIEVEGDDISDLERAMQEQFESYNIGGGYSQALNLLVDGNVDAAAGAHDAPERFLEPEQREDIRTLERLGRVPSHPIVASQDLDEELKDDFVEAMLLLNEPENVHLLEEIYGVEGLEETDTETHLGDFGPAFEALVGIRDQVMG